MTLVDQITGEEIHNRWAPDCARFRAPVGPDTQYLVDWHRFSSCPSCQVRMSSVPTEEEK